jgi:two-component system response regulator PilR (NtrC family)
VVDDEPLIRWAVSETLTSAGHDVVQAGDAQSALRALKDARGGIDVVLLDLRLPDSSDLTLLSRIRESAPACAVVMMSAYATAEVAAEARALGAYEVVAKPFDVDHCEPMLRRAHNAIGH